MLRLSLRLLPAPPTAAWIVLAISVAFNAITWTRVAKKGAVEWKGYSYVGDDYPRELPVQLDFVGMTFENSEHYRATGDLDTWTEWQTLTHMFPQGHASVRLGPEGREFNVSMFTQLECIETLRQALIYGPNARSGICLNYLRQAVLCASDITIDAMDTKDDDGNLIGTDGVGSTHVCRDWSRVYEYVTENQKESHWALPTTTM
ncbi:uncharacterized protein C8Q71DRAFT_799565 [Rhodofomes roseus]|uniref:Uncharacterized protein n=1 Tax=Rhodofomes roseus TaxID=34475 RepID=A0ABQ8K052_9APHY|nr:uncharacterized protein C8Q71DRAFT_799565 [Rhodofomes roseus]KAH9830019.1 hypothetical protein C8Q71DRAFT_799565 [Rhodofomes roseus]